MKSKPKTLAPVLDFFSIKMKHFDDQIKEIQENAYTPIECRFGITAVNLERSRLISFYNFQQAFSSLPGVARSRRI